MRDIKFRAWSKNQHMMLSSKTLFSENLPLTFLRDTSFELMQFTGLHDKNEVEIFEGDIIKCSSVYYCEGEKKNIQGFNAEIVFEDGCYLFRNIELGAGGELDWASIRRYDIEVIGNIYKNKYLIENHI